MIDRDMIVGLDIGTSSICVAIAEYNEEGVLELSGTGIMPSEGIRKGVVVNLEAAQKAISAAIEMAEQEAGRTVREVYTAVTGGNVEGLNSRGVVAVSGKNREVTELDIQKVLEAAKAIAVPMDREILHVVPQTFMVDEKVGIRDPKDMMGVRLESYVHIITGSVAATQNIIKCINRCGYKVHEISLESLVASEAVLLEEEKELGTLFLDIGGGTSDAIVFMDGAPHYTASLALGGDQISSDISIVLKQSKESAERLKLEYGACWQPIVDPEAMMVLPTIAGQPPIQVSALELCEIIESRVAEMLLMIREQLKIKGYLNRLHGGVVISGGTAHLPGMVELASDIFRQPVRIGLPSGLRNISSNCRDPLWATALGLVLFADKEGSSYQLEGDGSKQAVVKARSFWQRLKEWLINFI